MTQTPTLRRIREDGNESTASSAKKLDMVERGTKEPKDIAFHETSLDTKSNGSGDEDNGKRNSAPAWMVVSDAVACDKVKMRFRHLRVQDLKDAKMTANSRKKDDDVRGSSSRGHCGRTNVNSRKKKMMKNHSTPWSGGGHHQPSSTPRPSVLSSSRYQHSSRGRSGEGDHNVIRNRVCSVIGSEAKSVGAGLREADRSVEC